MTRGWTGGLVVLALLALGACAQTPPDSAAEDAWLRTVYAKRGNIETEAAAFRQAQGRAVRPTPKELVLTLRDGRKIRFRNTADEDGDGDDYSLIAYLPARHSFLVEDIYYEGGAYVLVDDRSGEKTEIQSIPMFSPDGQHLLVQNDDDGDQSDGHCLEIWRRAGGRMQIEWSADPSEDDTGMPMPFGPYHTDVLRWEGERIVLRFSNADFDAPPDPEHSWTATLIHDSGGWHLDARRRPKT